MFCSGNLSRRLTTEVAEFEAWRRTLTLIPTIVELRSAFQQVVREEVKEIVQPVYVQENQVINRTVDSSNQSYFAF